MKKLLITQNHYNLICSKVSKFLWLSFMGYLCFIPPVYCPKIQCFLFTQFQCHPFTFNCINVSPYFNKMLNCSLHYTHQIQKKFIGCILDLIFFFFFCFAEIDIQVTTIFRFFHLIPSTLPLCHPNLSYPSSFLVSSLHCQKHHY